MNSVIKRCVYCGRPITRPDTEHVIRKRNSLDLTEDSCARCNRKRLQKWDEAGELPAGPVDSLLNISRRIRLIAQSLGLPDDTPDFEIFERWVLNDEKNKPLRRRLRVVPESEHQEMLTATVSIASLIDQVWSYLGRYINPDYLVEYQILKIYVQRIHENPGLFLEWWNSADHQKLTQINSAPISVIKDHNLDIDGTATLRLMMGCLIGDASVFLKWLHDRLKEPEYISD